MSATFLKTEKNSRGVTLIETIVYVVILTLVLGIIVQILVSIGGIYRNVKVTRELESSGTIVMERMLREISNASNVVVNESVLGTSPGVLTIFGTDENLNPYKITFSISNDVVQISKNGETPTALTSSLGTASYLLFTRVATSTSEGVRIELEMSNDSNASFKSERFYGFSVLRGSY